MDVLVVDLGRDSGEGALDGTTELPRRDDGCTFERTAWFGPVVSLPPSMTHVCTPPPIIVATTQTMQVCRAAYAEIH